MKLLSTVQEFRRCNRLVAKCCWLLLDSKQSISLCKCEAKRKNSWCYRKRKREGKKGHDI